ncbi:hypothetical protein C8F01DRAFT_1378188 [Mycena amicta]|nr:hypothetical protein C8F01DRAFT_1378188 [Mycena amicta]
MPVSFKVADHKAEPVAGGAGLTTRQILAHACSPQYANAGVIRGTSFQVSEPVTANIPKKQSAKSRLSGLFTKKNKFTAYNKHHALVLRPDDVWLAILVQFNFFVNANSELLRANFVAHEGSKTLTVSRSALSDFGEFARAMVGEIDKNVVNPTLRAWVLPKFTTTTERDTTVASILLMATLKAYFEYVFCDICCGIPRKLKEYGVQTMAWYHLLVPILSRFVKAFDDPESDSNIDFWQKISHFRRGGSGPDRYTGWISAFCVFNDKGKWIGQPLKEDVPSAIPPDSLSAKEFWATYAAYPGYGELVLDDTHYHSVDADNIPPCYAEVDVLLVDNTGEKTQASMTAGVIGTEVTSDPDTGVNNIVKPLVGWWLFNKLEQ